MTRLTASEQETLLHIARKSIESSLHKSPFDPRQREITPVLEQPSGAFVTLHARGDLRGCIGSVIAASPLYVTVFENARNAAFRDPRFEPVRVEEFQHLSIEISVLSPPRRVASVEEIEVGTHGLIVRTGWTAGLLLPQVATEQGWDRDAFLDHTCLKAGLARTSWRTGQCSIEMFTATVFGEEP